MTFQHSFSHTLPFFYFSFFKKPLKEILNYILTRIIKVLNHNKINKIIIIIIITSITSTTSLSSDSTQPINESQKQNQSAKTKQKSDIYIYIYILFSYHGYRFVRKRSSFLTHPRQDRVEHRTELSESDRTCNFQKLQRKLKKKKKTIIRRIQSSRENFCF